MRRTNEEFRAEVFRRKDEYLKKRKKRIVKGITTALVCLPLCFVVTFMGFMLAIAMAPCGSAGPSDGINANGALNQDSKQLSVTITASDTRFEYICALFGEIEARAPEKEVFDWNTKEDFEYDVLIESEDKHYYLNEGYLFTGTKTFSITEEEYEKFLDIIEYGGRKYYEN